MVLNHAKRKEPFSAPGMTEDFCATIGKIAITWAEVEYRLDKMIEALLHETGEVALGWERRNFKKRKELCKDLSKQAFAANPAIYSTLATILASAADLHWKRNFIMHGRLSIKVAFVPQSPKSFLTKQEMSARSRHNGRDTTLYFSNESAEQLFVDIAHVSGRLLQLSTPEADVLGLALPDKARLRDFLRANHPNLPKP